MNWLVKLAGPIYLRTDVHSKNGRPIHYVVGDTYPVYRKLKTVFPNYYGAKKIWWQYSDRVTPEMIRRLADFGVDVSEIQGATAAPAGQEPASAEPTPQEPPAGTVVTDQTWDGAESKSKWYGFPIKDNIWGGSVTWQIDGEPHDFLLKVNRHFQKGRRRIPSYTVSITYPDGEKTLKTFGQKAPGEWGSYDEGQYIAGLPAIIQEKIWDAKGKTYQLWQAHQELAKRSPELTQYLEGLAEYDDTGKKRIRKTIRLDAPGYEGEYPIELEAFSHGHTFHIRTALEHALAPYPKTLGSLYVPYELRTIEDFNRWLDEALAEPKVLLDMQQDYLEYLQSFAFKPEQEAAQREEIRPIVEMIQKGQIDTELFKTKLMELGYVRPSKRQPKRGPGMQAVEEIRIVIDDKKIRDVIYGSRKLKNSPEFFYAVLAYYVMRKARNITSWTEMILTDSIRDFSDLLDRFGIEMTFRQVSDYFDRAAVLTYQALTGRRAPRSRADAWSDFYGGGGGMGGETPDVQMPSGAVEQFANFVARLPDAGVTAEQVMQDPKSAYRQMALKWHPDRNKENPEAGRIFGELSTLWNQLPAQVRLAQENWLTGLIKDGL